MGIFINSEYCDHELRKEKLKEKTGILCESGGWSDITDILTYNFFQPFGNLHDRSSLDVRYLESCSGSANSGERLVVVDTGDNLLLVPHLGSMRVKANDGSKLNDVYAIIRKDVIANSNNGDIATILEGASKVFDALKTEHSTTQVECEYRVISLPQKFVPLNYRQENLFAVN